MSALLCYDITAHTHDDHLWLPYLHLHSHPQRSW